jgi:hypothetical protein
VAIDVTITLEPIKLQAIANIKLLEAAQAAKPSDEARRLDFLKLLEKLVDDLTARCGAGMGVRVTFKGGAKG